MRPSRRRVSWWSLCVFGATVAAYFPALKGELVWDDEAHVTKKVLRDLHGLWRIWVDLGATQQYYPVLHSAFWLEHRLWGDATLGYHLVNVLLHATAACLFAVILRRLSPSRTRLGRPVEAAADLRAAEIRLATPLSVARRSAATGPGGPSGPALPWEWLAAFLFALHPVCVESVAWISEQKNTLSLVFYLLAALAYLGFDEGQGGRRPANLYALSLCLFLLAVLSKSVTSTLPAALLIVIWLKRGRLDWKRDVTPLLPWLAAGAAAGLFTAWVESRFGGASGGDFALGFTARCLLAGRAIWFYLGKLIWPANLIFIYPHWRLDPGAWWQWLFSFGILAGLFLIWRWRRRYPGNLAGFLFYIGSLFPALGFLNVYPFIYSYVADHFQYLASLGFFALAAGGWGRLLARVENANSKNRRTSRPGLPRTVGAPCLHALTFILVASLATLTWSQCRMYRDAVTLYQTILARNPACSMAHNNLGKILFEAGHAPEAIAHYRQALSLSPNDPLDHYDLGVVLYDLHRYPEAIDEMEEALRLRPNAADEHYSLGNALAEAGRTRDAVAHFREALRLNPNYPEVHLSWGSLLARDGRFPDAIIQYEAALKLHPDIPGAHSDIAVALASMNRTVESMAEFQVALRLQPDAAGTRYNYANALMAMGDLPGAVAQYGEAVRIKPDYADARVNLGIALLKSGRRDEALAQFAQAVGLDSGNARARLNYGVALASRHRLDEAISEFEAAVRLQPADPAARSDLADALLEAGRMSEARAQYDEAERLRGGR